ncbi:MAG TPA: hypothetical protein PLJ21_02835 [Pseudobdellovibrionaceae bacterium]|nr:hypothetical protein [Pseudobdellovibrionaceae bacterium]
MPGWLFIRTPVFKLFLLGLFLISPLELERGLSFYLLNPMNIQLPKGTPAYRAFELIGDIGFQENFVNKISQADQNLNLKTFTLNSESLNKNIIKLQSIKIQKEVGSLVSNSKIKHIEIGGGLAITHENQIKIERYIGGQFKEEIPIDHLRGEFDLGSGFENEEVYAKLINTQSGEILGESKVDLQSPITTIHPTRRGGIQAISFEEYTLGLTHPFVKTIQNSQGKSQKRLSANSAPTVKSENPDQVASPGTEDKENQKDKTIAFNAAIPTGDSFDIGGQYVFSAQGADGVKTFALLPTSYEKSYIPTFSQKNISAIMEILQSQAHKTLDQRFMILGSVKGEKGLGESGVNLLVESDLQSKIFYFNDFFIPDVNLKETSSNGMFIILSSRSGYQSIVAQKKEKFYTFANVITAPKIISFVEMKYTLEKNKTQIKSIDPIQQSMVSAQVQLQGFEKTVQTRENIDSESRASVELSGFSLAGLIYTAPENENYENSKSIYFENQKEITLPAISKKWIQKVKESMDAENVSNLSSIVGFVNIENFEVFVPEKDRSQVKIAYFNKEGLILSGAKGIRGGGFIILTSKKEMQSFFIFNPQTKKFIPQILPIDQNDLTTLML